MSVPVLSWSLGASRSELAARSLSGPHIPTQPSTFHGRAGDHRSERSPEECPGPNQQARGSLRHPRRLVVPLLSPNPDLAQSGARTQARFPHRPDWPDPQSQSLSRSYGSNLPTSLTYISLSTRGFSPWRPAADMGTHRPENHRPQSAPRQARRRPLRRNVRSLTPAAPKTETGSSLAISWTGSGARDAARTAALYGLPCTNTLSHSGWLPGSRRLKQKRELFPGPLPANTSLAPLPGSYAGHIVPTRGT